MGDGDRKAEERLTLSLLKRRMNQRTAEAGDGLAPLWRELLARVSRRTERPQR